MAVISVIIFLAKDFLDNLSLFIPLKNLVFCIYGYTLVNTYADWRKSKEDENT